MTKIDDTTYRLDDNSTAYIFDKYITGSRPSDIQRKIDSLPSGAKAITTVCAPNRIKDLPQHYRKPVSEIACNYSTQNIIIVELI